MSFVFGLILIGKRRRRHRSRSARKVPDPCPTGRYPCGGCPNPWHSAGVLVPTQRKLPQMSMRHRDNNPAAAPALVHFPVELGGHRLSSEGPALGVEKRHGDQHLLATCRSGHCRHQLDGRLEAIASSRCIVPTCTIRLVFSTTPQRILPSSMVSVSGFSVYISLPDLQDGDVDGRMPVVGHGTFAASTSLRSSILR